MLHAGKFDGRSIQCVHRGFVIVHGLRQTLVRERRLQLRSCLGVEADDGCRPRSSGNGYVASHGRCSFQRRTQRQGKHALLWLRFFLFLIGVGQQVGRLDRNRQRASSGQAL